MIDPFDHSKTKIYIGLTLNEQLRFPFLLTKKNLFKQIREKIGGC